jgi:U3 small nucleolar RNA-associated protein 10
MQDADPHTRAMAHIVARALLGRLSGEHQIDAAEKMLDAMHLETLDGMEDIHDNEGEMVILSSFRMETHD